MRRLSSFLAGAGLVLAVTGAVALLRAERVPATGNEFGVAARSTFSVAEARAFAAWPLYNLGGSFEGLPLTAVLRHEVTTPFDPKVTKIRPNYVSFVYGDCRAEGEAGCAPPLEVQVSPACRFRPSDIELPPVARTRVRGVEASLYEEGAKLVFAAGRSTVAIYGRSRADVMAAAAQLRGVNVALSTGDPLPAPAAAAQAGSPRC